LIVTNKTETGTGQYPKPWNKYDGDNDDNDNDNDKKSEVCFDTYKSIKGICTQSLQLKAVTIVNKDKKREWFCDILLHVYNQNIH
jgi:hypothetical protein